MTTLKVTLVLQHISLSTGDRWATADALRLRALRGCRRESDKPGGRRGRSTAAATSHTAAAPCTADTPGYRAILSPWTLLIKNSGSGILPRPSCNQQKARPLLIARHLRRRGTSMYPGG